MSARYSPMPFFYQLPVPLSKAQSALRMIMAFEAIIASAQWTILETK